MFDLSDAKNEISKPEVEESKGINDLKNEFKDLLCEWFDCKYERYDYKIGTDETKDSKAENEISKTEQLENSETAEPKLEPNSTHVIDGKEVKMDENDKFIPNNEYKTNDKGERFPQSPEGYKRPYLREEVKKEIYDNAPKDKKGRYLDPNTGKPIEGKPDIGHKPGHEHWREAKKAFEEGISLEEFNNRMNNPDYYQLEDPSNNRSHKYEDKSEYEGE